MAGPSAAASKALKPAWVSSTWARGGMSGARTKWRNKMMILSSLSPVLCGSVAGPSGRISTAPSIP
jgi:hypothetical protein